MGQALVRFFLFLQLICYKRGISKLVRIDGVGPKSSEAESSPLKNSFTASRIFVFNSSKVFPSVTIGILTPSAVYVLSLFDIRN